VVVELDDVVVLAALVVLVEVAAAWAASTVRPAAMTAAPTPNARAALHH
jgi:hypothetical protein